jgi:hypothetical protein
MKNLFSVHRAEKMLKLTPEGNGSYGLHPDTMKPLAGMTGGPRTPAQQQATKKAQAASAMKRSVAP